MKTKKFIFLEELVVISILNLLNLISKQKSGVFIYNKKIYVNLILFLDNPLIPLTGHTFCSNRGKGYVFGGMLKDVTNFL
jgi:hypothetical protein